jgi:methionyl-tRNA formyltransferase
MRILLLGHREIASNIALNLLVRSLPGHELRIALSGVGDKHGPDAVPDLVELDKVEQAMCDALDSGVVAGSALPPGLLGFEALAVKTGQALEVLADPNSDTGLEMLRDWAPELILSVRYRKILHQKAISIPPKGILNLHSGLLPDFRGVMATFHSLLAGSDKIGSTLHLITDSGIDTGPIIATCPIDADYEATYLDNVFRLYPIGCAAMVAAVNQLAIGKILIKKEKTGDGVYFSAPTLELCTDFREAGLRLCDGRELERIIPRLLYRADITSLD